MGAGDGIESVAGEDDVGDSAWWFVRGGWCWDCESECWGECWNISWSTRQGRHESAWPVALSAGTGDSGRVRKRNERNKMRHKIKAKKIRRKDMGAS